MSLKVKSTLHPAVQRRQRIEYRIARRVIRDVLAAGFWLAVGDGDGGLFNPPSNDARRIGEDMAEMDDDMLYIYRADATADSDAVGWVRFIYGNDGPDVVNDYTTNLETLMAGANALAERLARGLH